MKTKYFSLFIIFGTFIISSCSSIYDDYAIRVSSGSLPHSTNFEDITPRAQSLKEHKTGYQKLKLAFEDPTWYDEEIPPHRWCKKYNARGKSPALFIRNIPKGVNVIVVEFNNNSCAPLSYGGGMGAIRIKHDQRSSTAYIPAVETESYQLPNGVYKESRHHGRVKSSGVDYPPCDKGQTQYMFDAGEEEAYATAYLAPCSGGAGHSYSADVKALYRKNFSSKVGEKLLGAGRINMGIDDLYKAKSIRSPVGFNHRYR
jgi:hypothetical protein